MILEGFVQFSLEYFWLFLLIHLTSVLARVTENSRGVTNNAQEPRTRSLKQNELIYYIAWFWSAHWLPGIRCHQGCYKVPTVKKREQYFTRAL